MHLAHLTSGTVIAIVVAAALLLSVLGGVQV